VSLSTTTDFVNGLLWERVTKNGLRDPEEFCWGAAGSRWWDESKMRFALSETIIAVAACLR
jgi:hypothetical protein